MPHTQGIDVSHYQGQIHWQQVQESGIEFAFIKATEGEQIVDPCFFTNWQEAKKQGIRCGAYHFFHANEDAAIQAQHFIDTVFQAGVMESDLPPALDLEVDDGIDNFQLVQKVNNWLTMVENKFQQKPLIYTNNGFWNSHMNGKYAMYPLWIADWNGEQAPDLPSGWDTWAYWQFSEKGRVPGIQGFVDINCRNRT